MNTKAVILLTNSLLHHVKHYNTIFVYDIQWINIPSKQEHQIRRKCSWQVTPSENLCHTSQDMLFDYPLLLSLSQFIRYNTQNSYDIVNCFSYPNLVTPYNFNPAYPSICYAI